jgi:hypothetical protein
VEVRVFICESTSRSWAGGSVFSVREMASGQLRPGGRSTPMGRGGRVEVLGWGGGLESPLEGRGVCW